MKLSKTLTVTALFVFLTTAFCFAANDKANEVLLKGDDPRLNQLITYSAEGTRIADVLAQLTEMTGVPMVAGAHQNDWMVYDRKVIVYVTNMKLVDLMQELSRALSFGWARDGEQGNWAYGLLQSSEQAAEEQSLREKIEDSKAKQAREARENLIADMANLGALSDADSAKLKETDPWRYVLATESLGKDIAAFLNSYPEAKNAFVQGLGASFPVSILNQQTQETVKRIANSYNSLTKSIGVSADQSDLLSKFDKLQITINRSSLVGGGILSKSILGSISIGYGTDTDYMDVPLFDSSSLMARAFGTAVIKLKSGVSKDQVGKLLKDSVQAMIEMDAELVKPSRDISSDSDLKASVVLFSDKEVGVLLPVALKALAEKTGFNIVSDYFPAKAPLMMGGARTVGQQLELIRNAYGVNWEKIGKMIRLRDDQWFIKRTWEVPQVWISYWTFKADPDQSSGLELSDLAEIAHLRDEQIDNTIKNNPVLMRMGAGDAVRNREILRLYWSLTDEQKKEIASVPLSVNKLNQDQWEYLKKAIATKGAAYAVTEKGSQTIALTKTGSDVIDYTFIYYPGSNEAPVKFTMTTGLVYRSKDEIEMPDKKEIIQFDSGRNHKANN